MQTKCKFDMKNENEIRGFDGLYQVCSCGKHVWSTRTKRILKPSKNNTVRIYNKHNKLSIHQLQQEKPWFTVWTLALLIFFVGVIIYVHNVF